MTHLGIFFVLLLERIMISFELKGLDVKETCWETTPINNHTSINILKNKRERNKRYDRWHNNKRKVSEIRMKKKYSLFETPFASLSRKRGRPDKVTSYAMCLLLCVWIWLRLMVKALSLVQLRALGSRCSVGSWECSGCWLLNRVKKT